MIWTSLLLISSAINDPSSSHQPSPWEQGIAEQHTALEASNWNPLLLSSLRNTLVSQNPPSRGTPRTGPPGGTRGDCPETAIPPTALVPPTGGYTTADHPMVWVYVPYALSATTPAILTVEDSNYQLLYQSPLITNRAASQISGFTIPTVLAVGEPYTWRLQIFCNDASQMEPPVEVGGEIQRVAPGSSPANQIWYDQLTQAATRHRANPRDASWHNLLESIGQGNLATTPIAPH